MREVGSRQYDEVNNASGIERSAGHWREGEYSLYSFGHPNVSSSLRHLVQLSSVVRAEKDDVGLPQVPHHDA